MSSPSPKEFYDALTAKFNEKKLSGKEWEAWLQQQSGSLKGKPITWVVEVSTLEDYTDKVKGMRSEVRQLNFELEAAKKGKTTYMPGNTGGPFTPSGTYVHGKTAVEELESRIAALNRLLRVVEISPLVINPIDGSSGRHSKHTGTATQPGRMPYPGTGRMPYMPGRMPPMGPGQPGNGQVPTGDPGAPASP